MSLCEIAWDTKALSITEIVIAGVPLSLDRDKGPARTERDIVGSHWLLFDTVPHARATTTGNQGSGVLSSMVQANGLIVLHHGQGNVAVGDAVDVMVFEGVI